MQRRIAIVGSGVAGLVAAYKLHASGQQITLYEADFRLGGHAHTVTVIDQDRELALDTGFIVFNEATYPRFTELLQELGIRSQMSNMSFGVSCQQCRLEYSSRGISGLFAHAGQILKPSMYLMAADILRFNRWARKQLAGGGVSHGMTLADIAESGRFGSEFYRHYLAPMTSAIWSSTTEDVDRFPLPLFLKFFDNHGLLQVNSHPPWRTVVGGSQRYVESLVHSFRDCIRLDAAVDRIRRRSDGVELHTVRGGWEEYDKVVLATHANQALSLLEKPSAAETYALGAIPYSKNLAVLHTDASVLPRSRRAWASWNYHIPDCRISGAPLRMTYYLNQLQSLTTNTPYCVTLNDECRIDRSRVLARIPYEHPVYTVDGLEARSEIKRISGRHHTFYCGAHLGNGFHEDGVVSGLAVQTALEQCEEWK